ncbi:MAG: hypothetical protein Q8L38_03740 [Pseudohongiella sp.]|nr:hypothetical protein [Pseudohongiella sp.]
MTEFTRDGSNSTEVPATEDQAGAQPEMGGDFLMVSWISLLMALLVTTVMLAAYHFWLAKPTAGFAVLDLASVVKIKETEFTTLLSRPNVSDEDRKAAYLMVSRIGPAIERAVDRLQKECGCTIVVKSAVIAGPAEDLTPRLKAMLGMSPGTEAQGSGVKP